MKEKSIRRREHPRTTGKHTSEIKTDSIFNNNSAYSYCAQSYKAEGSIPLFYSLHTVTYITDQTPFEIKQQ